MGPGHPPIRLGSTATSCPFELSHQALKALEAFELLLGVGDPLEVDLYLQQLVLIDELLHLTLELA